MEDQPVIPRGARVLRPSKVCDRLGIRMSALYDRLAKPDKYPGFPRPIKLGGGAGGAVGFLEHELDAWIAARAAERVRVPA